MVDLIIAFLEVVKSGLEIYEACEAKKVGNEESGEEIAAGDITINQSSENYKAIIHKDASLTETKTDPGNKARSASPSGSDRKEEKKRSKCRRK